MAEALFKGIATWPPRRSRAKRVGVDVGNLEPVFVGVRSLEWFHAWKGLVDVTGDTDHVAVDPQSGEAWQYLGTVRWPEGWLHEFRHRWHPRLQQRWCVRVPASETWAKQQLSAGAKKQSA
jgi:hypothetical protein